MKFESIRANEAADGFLVVHTVTQTMSRDELEQLAQNHGIILSEQLGYIYGEK